MTDLKALLESDEMELERRWTRLVDWLEEKFGRLPEVESILFLIGVQSRGRGYEPQLPKQMKQDLIMEGTHLAMETLGLYERVPAEQTSRSDWRRSQPLPDLTIAEQEKLLRLGILRYFQPN